MVDFTLPSQRAGQATTGYWGDHTATLDWCEINYEVSPYIAEFVNTMSNLPIILLGIYGVYTVWNEKLPSRIGLCYASEVLIGLGSTGFHMSLQSFWQMMDEIPMIWSTSLLLFCAFETSKGYQTWNYGYTLPIAILLFNLLVTYTCLFQLSATLHEVGFGLLVTGSAGRMAYLLLWKRAGGPSKDLHQAVNLFKWGIACFLLGFLIWNIDNLCCDYLLPYKQALGFPLKFLLEGHQYWHHGTGVAAYGCITGSSYIVLAIKEDPANFEFKRGFLGLPYVGRTAIGWKNVGVLVKKEVQVNGNDDQTAKVKVTTDAQKEKRQSKQ